MCSSDAPAPDPAIGQAARLNAETAKEALDFYKTIYETDLKPRQERDAQLREELITDFVGASKKQQRFADKQKNYRY